MKTQSAAEYKDEFFDKFKECRDAFMALGDETRQLIMKALLECGKAGMRVGDITSKMKLSRPAVSHHLKILKSANLVKVNRVGTKNYYYADTCIEIWEQIQELAASLLGAMKNEKPVPEGV